MIFLHLAAAFAACIVACSIIAAISLGVAVVRELRHERRVGAAREAENAATYAHIARELARDDLADDRIFAVVDEWSRR